MSDGPLPAGPTTPRAAADDVVTITKPQPGKPQW